MLVQQVKPFSVSSRSIRGKQPYCKPAGRNKVSAQKQRKSHTCVHCASREMEWQETALQPSQSPLPPRSGHCIARMPKGSSTQAFIFGGYTEDEAKQRAATNGAWVFSLQQGSWRQPDVGSSHLPRARIASQAICVGNFVWLIGGWDPGSKGDGGQILNDVWRLDLSTWTWTEAPVQAAAVGDTIYLHTHRSLSDILVLEVADPDKPKLKQVPVSSTQGATPSARGLHTVTAVGNKLYLFGGASQKGQMVNDLWVLDLSTMQWEELHPKGEPPHIRCSHTAVLVEQDIVFFGGSYYREDGKGLQPMDDVFVYDTTSNEWQRRVVSGTGPAARNAAVACLVGHNKMLLHGGWDPFRNTYSDSFILQC